MKNNKVVGVALRMAVNKVKFTTERDNRVCLRSSVDDKRIKIFDTEQIERLDFNSLCSMVKQRATGNAKRMFEDLEPSVKQAVEADASLMKDATGNFDITLQNIEVVRKI
jgi:hypothetical protein